jgi:hypothetical protein
MHYICQSEKNKRKNKRRKEKTGEERIMLPSI